VRELGLQSYMCVPLFAREGVFGVISFVSAESGRRYGPDDLTFAEELARRAGTAIENAQLYREAEERAQAARVLEAVGDGVFLVDSDGIVRLWNRSAEALTGLARGDVVGRAAQESASTRERCTPFAIRRANAHWSRSGRTSSRRCRTSCARRSPRSTDRR
jgi:GAF domain-containing protein